MKNVAVWRCLGLLLAAGATACGVVDDASADRPQPEPDVTILSQGDRPGDVGVSDEARMRITPPVTAPGTVIQVAFPNQEMRGAAFMLERFDAGVWNWEWAVHSEPAAPEPRVWDAQEFMRQGTEWDAEARFTGAQSHPVPVPDGAPLGTYRVCTVGSPEKLCAEFDVAQP